MPGLTEEHELGILFRVTCGGLKHQDIVYNTLSHVGQPAPCLCPTQDSLVFSFAAIEIPNHFVFSLAPLLCTRLGHSSTVPFWSVPTLSVPVHVDDEYFPTGYHYFMRLPLADISHFFRVEFYALQASQYQASCSAGMAVMSVHST